MSQRTRQLKRTRRIYLALLGLIVLIALVAFNVQALLSKSASLTTAYNPAFLFGENIGLDGTDGMGDKFLTNPIFRSGLQTVHTQMIRLPVRGPSPITADIKNLTAVEQAAAHIKALGMTPLVILRNPKDPTLLLNDTTVIKHMNNTFNGPHDVVYYEFGNELDSAWDPVNRVDPTTYYQTWNTIIPQLRAISINGKFGGPALSSYSPGNYPHYLQTFLQNVTAIPDFISWHEYTCGANEASSLCLSRIDSWTTHIKGARSLMDATIHRRLPIIISEWNFDANLTRNGTIIDNRYSDSAFMTRWTTKALQTLYDNQIFASMHFDVGGLQPLADSNGNPTLQGQVFSNMYIQLRPQKKGMPPLSMVGSFENLLRQWSGGRGGKENNRIFKSGH